MEKTAIVVEDDTNAALAMTSAISSLGFAVRTAGSLKEAQSLYRDKCPDIVFLDVTLPDGDGLELLREPTCADNTRFVVVTGDSRQDVAVRSLRAGAADFLVKPVRLAALKSTIEKSSAAANDVPTRRPVYGARNKQSADGALAPAESVNTGDRSDMLLVGESNRIGDLRHAIQKLAKVNTNVVLTGEAGVDKIAAAFALHRRTLFSDVIAQVQCATGDVIIGNRHSGKIFSEFLRSAFSVSGTQKRLTLVLDDVEQLSDARQHELLSYLTARSIVGSQNIISPRIVCIKRSLDADTEGQLNNLIPDLQLCLWQNHLHIPALLERREDVLPMAHKLLEFTNTENKTEKFLSEHACERLKAYDWPGNVRELVNVISQAFQTNGSQIEVEDFLPSGDGSEPMIRSAHAMVGKTFWEVEKLLVQATLETYGGDKKAAAKTLGISLKTLYNRMNAYDIDL